jgi:hypothetical protein
MFIALMALALVASIPLFGGDLRALGRVRLHGQALLWLALLLQVLITDVVASLDGRLLSAVHLATYLLAAAFLWRNRHLRGLLLIGAGTLLNAGVIALNGGTLPASARALRAAGITPAPGEFANSGLLPHPVLPWLGDTMATPSWLPLRNVVSIGDLVALLGAAVLLHTLTQTWPVRVLTGGDLEDRYEDRYPSTAALVPDAERAALPKEDRPLRARAGD